MHCAVDRFARLVSRKNWPLFMDVQNKRTENASMVKLKPCPWCGSSAALLVNQIDGYPGRHTYACECLMCHAQAPLGELSDVWCTAEEAKEEAVRIWNRRAES